MGTLSRAEDPGGLFTLRPASEPEREIAVTFEQLELLLELGAHPIGIVEPLPAGARRAPTMRTGDLLRWLEGVGAKS